MARPMSPSPPRGVDGVGGERAARARELCARPIPNLPLVLDDDDDGDLRNVHGDTIHLAASAGRDAVAVAGPAVAAAADPTQQQRPLSSSPPAPRLHGDPDYELPQGRLTETSALRRRAAADAARRRAVGDGVSPEDARQQQQSPPQQPEQLPRVDRYGFFVDDDEKVENHRSDSSRERERHRRAVAQWRRMIVADDGVKAAAATTAQQRQHHPPLPPGTTSNDAAADALEASIARHPRAAKRLMRAGAPDEFRGLAWHVLSGGRALARLAAASAPAATSSSTCFWAPPTYWSLLAAADAEGDERADTEVLRDLGRTFPRHALLQQRQGPGQRALFQALRAYRALDPEVGYVQGMAFVVGVLLMYLPEEAAFWTFAGLMLGGVEGAEDVLRQRGEGEAAASSSSAVPAADPLLLPSVALRRLPLRAMFLPGMPGLRRCMASFERLVLRHLPALGEQLRREGVDPSLYCAPWFPTMYAYSLPFAHVLRVWDVLMSEASTAKPMHRVGLAMVASAERRRPGGGGGGRGGAGGRLSSLPFEQLVPALNGTAGGGTSAPDGEQGRRAWWGGRRRQAAKASAGAAGSAPSGRRRLGFPILAKDPDALVRAACRIKVSRALRQIEQQLDEEEQASST